MNIFRLAGDLSHLLAIFILLLKIWKTRSCAGKLENNDNRKKNDMRKNGNHFFVIAGISGKSQLLFTIVYISRYLDLFTTYVSLYNSVMKIVFLAGSGATIYMIYVKFRATYDHNHDSFRIEFLLIPTVLLALLINQEFTVMEVNLKIELLKDLLLI